MAWAVWTFHHTPPLVFVTEGTCADALTCQYLSAFGAYSLAYIEVELLEVLLWVGEDAEVELEL